MTITLPNLLSKTMVYRFHVFFLGGGVCVCTCVRAAKPGMLWLLNVDSVMFPARGTMHRLPGMEASKKFTRFQRFANKQHRSTKLDKSF